MKWWSQMSPASGPRADLAAAHAVGGGRRTAHQPVGHVDLVAGLLDYVIAGEPAEEVPVADLEFHFAHSCRLGLTGPAAGAVEIGADEEDLAHGPVANLGDAVGIILLVMALQADAHR